ncbi:MAG TPA: ABC transporter permease [Candidatus Polarisedimenticolia bacterium]|nr:ABC transporter permease [Candidatus Polarisedimenticolia bacterium]
MSKVGVVMRRELRSTVRRRSYLVVTFGMPFFASLYLGLFAFLPAYFMEKSAAGGGAVGIVDLAGVVRPEAEEKSETDAEGGAPRTETGLGSLAPSDPRLQAARELLDATAAPMRFRPFATRAEALEALRGRTIDRFYLLPIDYVARGAIESYEADEVTLGVAGKRAEHSLGRLLERSLLMGRVPDDLRTRVESPIDSAASAFFVLGRDGRVEPLDATARAGRLGIPLAFGLLLMMSLMISAGYLIQGVSEEKENRVIEVILSSVRPHQLLFGKLLGLGAAGLLQLLVWLTVAGFATSLVAAAVLAALDPRLFLLCLIFFLLGFLMIGSLMTGTGVLGSSARESQQLAAIWSLAAILPPTAAAIPIIDNPNGVVARVLGWFPITSPITMMLRCGSGRVPWWDVGIAILALLAGVVLALRLAGALFRLGLLMHGKRPGPREILRQLRRG